MAAVVWGQERAPVWIKSIYRVERHNETNSADEKMVPLQQTGRKEKRRQAYLFHVKEQPPVSLQQMSALLPGKQEEEQEKVSLYSKNQSWQEPRRAVIIIRTHKSNIFNAQTHSKAPDLTGSSCSLLKCCIFLYVFPFKCKLSAGSHRPRILM